ncbi:uncharacterized protein TA02630 [Theileria annulata]|uniref:WDHD1/CFT4 second beta-propeller domain-containing protein n=1 Tax=Theileria annulata TaxID=5874 RepID=Q4UD29_THEAN|nr:uncharacterized protein TA02630 [Theileria annulata]CAI75272.1 hypothetical protein TA02630 [Theileria annulata]|eukprot:XP_954748.1 hypothetical protein TA02630 [Theileria annulata]
MFTPFKCNSCRFIVFGKGTELIFYNFKDNSDQTFKLLDLLSVVDLGTEQNHNYNIQSLSVFSNPFKGSKGNNKVENKSQFLTKGSKFEDGRDVYLVTLYLGNGFIVLLKYDCELKLYFYHKLPLNEEDSDVNVSLYTFDVNDLYTLYLRKGELHLLSWSKDKNVKLCNNVQKFRLCNSTPNDKLLLVMENCICTVTVDELFISNALYSSLDTVLDSASMENRLEVSCSGLKYILDSNNLLFLLYENELMYTFLNKLSLYKFTQVQDVVFFNFQAVNDINLILTIDSSFSISIYDYDTVSTLFSLNSSQLQDIVKSERSKDQVDSTETNEESELDLKYNFCVLNGDLNLLLFDNYKLVYSLKLLFQEDKFVSEYSVDSTGKVSESPDKKPNEQTQKEKEKETEKAKRKMNDEKEEARYKKLKSISRRKQFLDLESMEDDDPLATSHTATTTLNDDSLESTSQLSYRGSQDKETATTGTETGEPGAEEEYDIENYGSYNVYNNGDNLVYLINEIKKLKRKVKQLEYLALPKEPKILTSGLCPKPNDQFKQWYFPTQLFTQLFTVDHRPLSGYIKKVDRYSCQMASLYLDGLVCGTNIYSTSQAGETADYNSEPDKETSKSQSKVGVVYYYNLYNNNENWDRRFPCEEIKAVSISSNYISVVTNLNILYLLTRNNMLLSVSKLKGSIVSLLTNKNMLVVVTQIITNTQNTVYNVNVLWINGIKGLTHNNTLKIITLYNDLLILSNNTYIKHLGLSNEYVLWYMDSKYKLWLLANNIKNVNNNDVLEWIPTVNVNSNYYPLYINNFNVSFNKTHLFTRLSALLLYINIITIQFIVLMNGERYPNCSKNISFFGYTLHNMSLTLNNETNTIINTHKGASTLRTEGASIGIDSSIFINTKLQVPESILENNIDIYDELRYIQNININQLQYIVNIIQLYNYWYISSDPTSAGDNKNEINKYLSSINIFEKNHDKILLRILAKIQTTNKLYKNSDIIQMLKIPKCLEVAKTIVNNDRYK